MKVVYLTNLPSPYRVDFFNELSKYCDLTVCFERSKAKNREDGWYKNKYNFKAIFLKSFEIGDESSISFEFIRYFKEEYDFIIIGGYSTLTAMISILYLKCKKIKFILNTDGGFINKEENKIIKAIKSFFISSASAWLCTGDNAKKYLCYYGANEKDIYTYPFSSIRAKDILDKPISKSQKDEIKKQLNISCKFLIISVGQIIPRKGFDILIRKCKDLKDTCLYIIGGNESEELKEIRLLEGIENVHYIDFLSKSDLDLYYNAADLFVFLTREDIWGLVINEALAKGLPIITSDKCGAGLEMLDSCSLVNLEQPFDIVNNFDIDIESRKNLDTAKKYTIEKMAKSHFDILSSIKGSF